MIKENMVENWEKFREEEWRASGEKWRRISAQISLEFGLQCNNTLCNIYPENDSKKIITVEKDDQGRLIFSAECLICGQLFERVGELPEKYRPFFEYYFFGISPSATELCKRRPG